MNFVINRLTLLASTLLLLLSYQNCSKFSAVEQISKLSPLADIKLKLMILDGEAYITSGVDISATGDALYNWSSSPTISGTYTDLNYSLPDLKLSLLGANFSGFVKLAILINVGNVSYRITGAPFEVEATTPLIEDTPTPVITVPTLGLVHHYKLNESSGTVISDSVGSIDGTLSGGANFISAIEGNGLDFNGSTGKVSLGNNFNLPADALTVSAYINPSSFTNTDARIISKADGDKSANHYMMVSTEILSGKFYLRFRLKTKGSTTTLIAGSSALELNKFTHVAAVYDGTQMSIFKDGVQIAFVDKSGSIDNGAGVETSIGVNPTDYQSFDGIIDDIRIYNVALSSEEIAALTSQCVNCLSQDTPVADNNTDNTNTDTSTGDSTNVTDNTDTVNDGSSNTDSSNIVVSQGTPSSAQMNILFEDSFDDQTDWFATEKVKTYKDDSKYAPAGWDFIYTTDKWKPSDSTPERTFKPSCAINSESPRGNTGKSLVVTDESHGRDSSWGSDCQLGKDLGSIGGTDKQYKKIFYTYYVKFPIGGNWDGNPAIKMSRIGHFKREVMEGNSTETGTVFRSSKSSAGLYLLDFHNINNSAGTSNLDSFRTSHPIRCILDYRRCYDTGSKIQAKTYSSEGLELNHERNLLGDGKWHKVEVYSQYTSSPGSKDGIVKFWFDGVLQYKRTNVPFNDGASSYYKGFNMVTIAGNMDHIWYCGIMSGTMCTGENANDPMNDRQEQSYYIDDVKIFEVTADEYN